MKYLFIIVVSLSLVSFTCWQTDFEGAKKEAKLGHKNILLNFSGSDWCGPCIRMHREIFSDTSFKAFANSNLVLVNADFPRQKKNRLAEEVVKSNEALAETYNSKGAFPFTLLLDADGKVVKTWEGLPEETPAAFVKEIDVALHAAH